MPTTTLQPNQEFREMELNPKRLQQSLLGIPNTSTPTKGTWDIVRKIIVKEVELEEGGWKTISNLLPWALTLCCHLLFWDASEKI